MPAKAARRLGWPDFGGIRTHSSCLCGALCVPGLTPEGVVGASPNHYQILREQGARDRDFHHLLGDMASMGDDPRADLEEILPQAVSDQFFTVSARARAASDTFKVARGGKSSSLVKSGIQDICEPALRCRDRVYRALS